MERTHKKKHKGVIAVILILIAVLIALVAYFAHNYFIRAEHPIKYQTLVEHYARENNIDKYLVYAVIKTESGFDSTAVSNVGARGLMQIMEDAFDWIKFKSGDEDTIYLDMFNVDDNIRYGTYLLGYLYAEFGNIEAAMAAYHAGRGQVNEWLADPEISSDGVHLDTIPIKDTAHYVYKINKAMEIYYDLYENK